MKSIDSEQTLGQNLFDDLLRDLEEEEVQESSFESRFTGALSEIIRRMSPRGREILKKLLGTDPGSHRKLPGLYKHVADLALLSASGQSDAPLRVPDKVIDFFIEHGDMPGCLVHCDVCRKCGAMVPFFNFFRENRLVRPFDVCPVCRNKMR